MIQNYNDAASPANANKWAMEDFGGETNSTYPTQFGFFNTGGSGQIGDYSNPTADSLINASVTGSNPAAVTDRGVVLHLATCRCCGSRCWTTPGPGRRTSRRPRRRRSRT